MALFVTMTGTNMVHIPYKGGAPSAVATMIGETQVTFSSVGAAIPPIRQGKLVALGVSGLKRNVALPDVPTVSEAGVSGYEASSWYGLFAQANTPQAIIAKLGEQSMKALSDAQLKERLLSQGIEPAAGGVEEFSSYFATEVVKWAKVIKAAAIPPQCQGEWVQHGDHAGPVVARILGELPPDPLAHAAAHDPLLVFTREPRHLFREHRHVLAVRNGRARKIGAPEQPLRTERVVSLA